MTGRPRSSARVSIALATPCALKIVTAPGGDLVDLVDKTCPLGAQPLDDMANVARSRAGHRSADCISRARARRSRSRARPRRKSRGVEPEPLESCQDHSNHDHLFVSEASPRRAFDDRAQAALSLPQIASSAQLLGDGGRPIKDRRRCAVLACVIEPTLLSLSPRRQNHDSSDASDAGFTTRPVDDVRLDRGDWRPDAAPFPGGRCRRHASRGNPAFLRRPPRGHEGRQAAFLRPALPAPRSRHHPANLQSPLMSRLAVGPGWAQLQAAQQQRLTDAFEHCHRSRNTPVSSTVTAVNALRSIPPSSQRQRHHRQILARQIEWRKGSP